MSPFTCAHLKVLLSVFICVRMHKVSHTRTCTFVTCDCIVFRLYADKFSSHGPNLAHCAE